MMGADAVAITGAALLTPLGGEEETWERLCAGERVVDGRVREGEIGDWRLQVDKSIRMGIAVGRRAIMRAGVRSGEGVGVFAGTSKGPVYAMIEGMDVVRSGREMRGDLADQIALGVGAMGVYVARELGLKGGVHTSVAACSSGMHALHRGREAVLRGECERALVVAADASLHELFEGSFARLGVLSPKGADGVRRCEPFGEAGKGFFLSEAAVAVVLEREPKGEVVAWLEDLKIGGDGTHLVAIDEETETLRRVLREVCGEGRIGFVHAHATGTGHDRFELAAIRSVVGEEVKVFSSKGALGHSLGAAGLVSVVLSAMGHARGRLMSGEVVEKGARSVTIAQGFGGHVAVARLLG